MFRFEDRFVLMSATVDKRGAAAPAE